MARGFESKGIESQQADRAAARTERRPVLTPEASERLRKREALEIQRRRIREELARATSDARRASLTGALAFLDAELQSLGES